MTRIWRNGNPNTTWAENNNHAILKKGVFQELVLEHDEHEVNTMDTKI